LKPAFYLGMAPPRPHGEQTREHLLDCACRTFSRKGFHEATVAEICRCAGANVAAVNYYFGTKAKLYAEAWRRAFERSMAAHPPDGGVPPEADPDRRLHGRVRALMERIADPECCEFEMVHKELANPTGLLAEVMRESIQPVRRAFYDVIAELLGGQADEQDILLCVRSVHGQCFDLMIHRRRLLAARRGQAGPEPPGPPPLDIPVEVLAEHVASFSLAGIRDLRRRIEAGETAGGVRDE
jgi:AcrR family transcriptional regulator